MVISNDPVQMCRGDNSDVTNIVISKIIALSILKNIALPNMINIKQIIKYQY